MFFEAISIIVCVCIKYGVRCCSVFTSAIINWLATIEDAVDKKMEEIQNKINQLNEFLDKERSKLRQPRDIDKP